MIRATVGVGINNIYKPKFPPTAVAKLLQYSDFRVEHRDEFFLHKLFTVKLKNGELNLDFQVWVKTGDWLFTD